MNETPSNGGRAASEKSDSHVRFPRDTSKGGAPFSPSAAVGTSLGGRASCPPAAAGGTPALPCEFELSAEGRAALREAEATKDEFEEPSVNFFKALIFWFGILAAFGAALLWIIAMV